MTVPKVAILGVLLAALLFGNFPFAHAAVMSSSSYEIQIDSINVGGGRGTSTSYVLQETHGEAGTGILTGSSNSLYGGFQLPILAADTTTSTTADAGGGGGQAFIPFEVLDVVIRQVTSNTVVVTFRTNKNATSQVRIGTQPGVPDRDVVVTLTPQSAHSVRIENLAPDTSYYFEITARTDRQEQTQSGEQTFKTLPRPGPLGSAPPANVQNFRSTAGDRQVLLQWQNPPDDDFAGVRIMRSSAFYALRPSDGILIYEGDEGRFSDVGLENGKQYYYTAFAYDADGNFASGAIASAIPVAPGAPPLIPPQAPPLVPPELVPEALKDLSLSDLDFIQSGTKVPVIAGRVEVEGDKPFTIAIDYDKLPEVLKTILVTMRNDKGELFSFLLGVNEEKTRYLATLQPPASGLYPISFTVVDYKNQGLQKVSGELYITEALGGTLAPPKEEGFGRFLPELLIFLLVSFGVIGVWVLARKYIGFRSKNAIRYIGCIVFAVLFVGLLTTEPGFAAFNTQINYQGKLTDTSSVAVSNGDYNFTFRLCTTSDCSGGSDPVWTETREGSDKVTVTSGIFSVLLGEVTSIASVDFNQTLWLEVQVGGTGSSPSYETLTPRKKLGAVAAAFEADKLDGISSGSFLRSDASDSYTSGTLDFSDGTYLDLSAILHDDTALQGLRLPQASSATPSSPTSGEGFLAWDTSGNQLISYDGSSWNAVGDSPFQTSSNVVNLKTSTDTLTIGSSTNLAKLAVDGDADEIQLLIQGHSTQTNNLVTFEQSSGTDIFSLTNNGLLTLSNQADSSSNQFAFFRGSNPATPADNDNAFISFTLEDDTNAQAEFARLTWQATDVTSTTKDGRLTFSAQSNNTLTDTLVIDGSNVFINDTANANSTIGLTINQGANDNEILSLKSSDVAHGLTGIAETDTFALFEKMADGTIGGLQLTSINDSNSTAFALRGIFGNSDPVDTAGAVRIVGAKSDGGTGIAALADAETILEVRNNTKSPALVVQGGGNVGIGTTSPTDLFTLRSDSAGFTVDVLRLENLATATASSGSAFAFYADRTTGGSTNYASIAGEITSIDNTNYAGKLDLKTAANGTLETQVSIGNPNVKVNRPLEVAVGGDVGIDYDLQFLNTGTSYITSEGPLRIEAGDANHVEILTLGTQGTGDVVVDVNDATATTGGFKVLGSAGYVLNAAPNGIIELLDPDVAHGLTGLATTSAYARFEAIDGTTGGLQLTSLNDSNSTAFALRGVIGNTDPVDSAGAVKIVGGKSDGGTSFTDLGSAETVLQVQNNNKDVFTVLGNAVVNMGLSNTASSAAVCSSLANSTDPTAGTLYELRDCDSAPAVDYMEFYATEEGVEIGDLVAPGEETVERTDGAKEARLVRTEIAYQPSLLGIVSDPALATDFNSIGENMITEGDNPMPVALSGRVQVKVNLENGPIKVGDLITSSSEAGVGMKAIAPGRVVGMALDAFEESDEDEMVMAFINPHWSMGSLGEDGLLVGVEGAGETEETGFVAVIKKAIESFTGTVKTAGSWVFEKITAKTARVEKLELVDQRTGEVYCTWIEHGEWVKVAAECDRVQYLNGQPIIVEQAPQYNDQNSNDKNTSEAGEEKPDFEKEKVELQAELELESTTETDSPSSTPALGSTDEEPEESEEEEFDFEEEKVELQAEPELDGLVETDSPSATTAL